MLKLYLQIMVVKWLLVHKVIHSTVLLCRTQMELCQTPLIAKGHNQMLLKFLKAIHKVIPKGPSRVTLRVLKLILSMVLR